MNHARLMSTGILATLLLLWTGHAHTQPTLDVPGIGKVQIPERLERLLGRKKAPDTPQPAASQASPHSSSENARPAAQSQSSADASTIPGPATPSADPTTTSEFVVVAAIFGHNSFGRTDITDPFKYLEGPVPCVGEPICKDHHGTKQQPFSNNLLKHATTQRVDATKRDLQNDLYGFRTSLTLPKGYEYCTSAASLGQMSPDDQKNGPIFWARADPFGGYFELWVKPYSTMPGEQYSKAVAKVSIVGVRTDLLSSKVAEGLCLNRPGF